jgi:hypothetical protein
MKRLNKKTLFHAHLLICLFYRVELPVY